MGYTVIPDTPATQGYTVLPASDNPTAAPTSVPGWAVGLGAVTGIDPSFLADPSQAVDALKALARQGGLTGRYALQGLASITDPINSALGIKRVRDTVSEGLTKLGVPQPETPGEQFVGDVSEGLTGVGAFGGVGKAIKAASAAPGALRAVGEALSSNMGAQAAGGTAASAAGSVANRQLDLSPAQQLFMSLAAGIAAPTAATFAGKAAAAGPRFVSSLVDPFTAAGQGRVVGQTLNRFAENPDTALRNITGAPEFVPGSIPSTAEASSDPGLLGLQRRLASEPDSGPMFTRLAAEQNRARLDALSGIAKDPTTLNAAIADRAATADADYSAAYQAGGQMSPTDNRTLQGLMDRPIFKQAWQKGEELAANTGMKPEDMQPENTQFLHFVKLGMDDVINGNVATSLGRNAKRAAIDTQNDFLNLLDNINPQYGIARGNYAEASGPIGRMTTLQDILQRAQVPAPDMLGNPVLSQAKWKNVVTNQAPDLAKTLTPDELSTLGGIGSDLDRAVLPATAGKAVGSNTVQNLATGNILAKTVGAGNVQSPIGRLLTYPFGKIYNWSGSEGQVQDLLDQAMVHPEIAARLMARVPAGPERTSLMQLLRQYVPRFALGAAESTAATPRSESP